MPVVNRAFLTKLSLLLVATEVFETALSGGPRRAATGTLHRSAGRLRLGHCSVAPPGKRSAKQRLLAQAADHGDTYTFGAAQPRGVGALCTLI